jgi:hypothetical protein
VLKELRHSSRSIVLAVCEDARRAELFDALLDDPCDYDMILVDSIANAYSRIKELRPDAIVIFTAIDDRAACQLLSLLTMDRDVAAIPVITCVTSRELDEFDAIFSEIDRHVSSGTVAAHLN